MTCAVLAPGEALPGRTCNDWSAFLVLVGSASAMGRTLGRDDYLLVRPGGTVGEIVGGSEGAQVLELRRTAR